ncbi:type II 3-dehydroquinate dehydratase [Agaribacter flavus]|uniref:3-dehydroquinate dehydratase n=1 Tax=Agaribacter flavus TaxID=1902781 RepID=A0ABV7FU26_9ALTE
MKILLLNGPNLNLLGKREPDIYGSETLADVEKYLREYASQCDCELSCLQSNAEHVLLDAIHQAMGSIDGVIINPGALTHTSVALRDAFLGTKLPFIEVHLSNVHARESFRHKSFLSDVAEGIIVGCGTLGYKLALDALIQKLKH